MQKERNRTGKNMEEKKAGTNFAFPFPGRELAEKELSYDPCYARIPAQDRAEIVNRAWNKGKEAARAIFREENGCGDFFAICRKNGLAVKERAVDYVVGGQRYFSDYVSGRSTITLYTKSVQLWAAQNHLEQRDAENLILSHEYYHFLEVKRIGLTSRIYQVPMLTIGPLKIGRTGIRALSEIGAHAFARTYAQALQESTEQ